MPLWPLAAFGQHHFLLAGNASVAALSCLLWLHQQRCWRQWQLRCMPGQPASQPPLLRLLTSLPMPALPACCPYQLPHPPAGCTRSHGWAPALGAMQ
jgi:hypothetical protein